MEIQKPQTPLKGSRYEDHEGRVLIVHEVVLDDPLGRQIRGQVLVNSGSVGVSLPYSCTQRDWVRIWRDKTPPAEFKQ